MTEKKTFKNLFLILSVILVILPTIITFNEFLTRIVMSLKFYTVIQNFIVPIETRMVVVIIRLFGIQAYPTSTSVILGSTHVIGSNVTISWNCIGWQSFILLLITLVTGLQGSYKLYTKLQTILIGFFGIFLINLLRISFVIFIAQFLGRGYSIIFHDYFSTIITLFWLFIFWWFSYTYVLEKEEH